MPETSLDEKKEKQKKEDEDTLSPSTTRRRIHENWDQDRAKHIQFKGLDDKKS